MTHHTPSNPAPADASRDPSTPTPGLPAVATPALDAHGFDPRDFEWRPVLRRRRADGWTPEVQRAFVQALADTGLVSDACRTVGMSVQSAYRLRHAVDAKGFANAWDAAVSEAATRLIDVAFTRAIEGVDIPVFDRDGCRIGAKRQYSDRLMMFLLRAYRPEQFRHAERDTRAPDETLPAAPAATPAFAALGPVVPDEPHRLVPPGALDHLMSNARATFAAAEGRDERERYVYPRNEDDHPAASERQHRRRLRDFAKSLAEG